jgi:hypothetical protein
MRRHRRALRIGGWAFVGIAAFGGLALCHPGGPGGLVSDVANYQQNNEDLADSQQKLRQLESATFGAHDRLRLKHELRDQLAQGTVPLAGAADAYLQAVSAEPALLPRFRDAVPSSNDQELMAINLLREVFNVLPVPEHRQLALLEQFRTTYGTDYPLPVPPARTSAAADSPVRP